MKQPIVWTIAGSDSSGFAGIQADLKTFNGLGVHGCSIITAITSQNNCDLHDIHYISTEMITSQLLLLQKTLSAGAIKISMLGQADIYDFLLDYGGWVVFDPVMISTSGKNLYSGNLNDYLLKIRKLLFQVDVFTPNLNEAQEILGYSLNSFQEIEDGARDILSLGPKSVLIKGGHFVNGPFCNDYWTDGHESVWLASERKDHIHFRGTGCTLSSAITACLAQGFTIKDALVISKMYINQCIRLANGGSLIHSRWPEREIDLPYLTHHPISRTPKKFPDCGPEPLGLYPVIDSVAWLETLLPLGVTTIQLRIKDKTSYALDHEIKAAIALANQYRVRLFINDYWQLAIRYGAYGVHLGQEDLLDANIEQIHQSGLRLGISTHCYYEVARAHAIRPSYIACGPIYPTTTKIMPFNPQGIENLKRWRRTLDYPLVAIGGINLDRMPFVHAAQVDGVALVTAITNAPDPVTVTRQLLNDYFFYNGN